MKLFKTLLVLFASVLFLSCEEEEVIVSDIINDWVAVSITDPNGEAVDFSDSGCYAQTSFMFKSDGDFSVSIKTPKETEAGGCDTVEYDGSFTLSNDEKTVSINKSLLKNLMTFEILSASNTKIVIKLIAINNKIGAISSELEKVKGYTYTLEVK